MTRQEIELKRRKNFDKIEALKAENNELAKQAVLLSDDTQWFVEQVEHHPKAKYQRQPNFLDGRLVGRVHWIDNIKDEDTGELIPIKRSRIVRIDGEWI